MLSNYQMSPFRSVLKLQCSVLEIYRTVVRCNGIL
jgi:hypothetical protein